MNEETTPQGETQNGPDFGVEETFAEESVNFTPPSAGPVPPGSAAPPQPGAPFATGPATFGAYPSAPGSGQYQPPTGYGAPGHPEPGYPAQGYEQVAFEQVPWSPKSKLAAGLFGILLGAFGVHNFYLGFTGKAVAQLLITVLSLGVLSFISVIWGLVEGILVLSSTTGTQWDLDAQGLPMRPIGSAQ